MFLMQSLEQSQALAFDEAAPPSVGRYQSYESLLQPENSEEPTKSTDVQSWTAAAENWKGLQVKESPSAEGIDRTEVSYDDTAVICYSSGTTGLPKGKRCIAVQDR